ncbi:hypothetical protein AB1Y20_005388 [Prymnesium parvum]|uniref:Uncharacterized protein n=1 Tax=Prymnesium parvum TaxID=97485 RepID=A0AB34J453_PRYPA
MGVTPLHIGRVFGILASAAALQVSPQCSRPPFLSRLRQAYLVMDDVMTSAPVTASSSVKPSNQWELDFYSRPVQGPDGKKLWELLVTDSAGSFQHVEAVPSNCVNSRELRSRVQRLIDASEVKPKSVRFFRVQMKNMISIALNELPGVECKPSRVTYRLSEWLEVREREVYPAMPGYRKPRPEPQPIKLPVKLPEQLRGEQYAFVTLPFAEFTPGGSINKDNVGFGSLCPVDPSSLPPDLMVPGIAIFSKRSPAIAAWLTGVDLAFVKSVLESREILLEVGLDTQYLLARMRTLGQTAEASQYEEQKLLTRGLHFLSVQSGPDSEQPDGFWLLKDTEASAKASDADRARRS